MLVVVKVVYVDNVARSVSIPHEPFEGDAAMINATAFVRKVTSGRRLGGGNRVEYHIVPAATYEGSVALNTWAEPNNDHVTGVRSRVPTKKLGVR